MTTLFPSLIHFWVIYIYVFSNNNSCIPGISIQLSHDVFFGHVRFGLLIFYLEICIIFLNLIAFSFDDPFS